MKIAVLAGDGIGQEVMAEGLKVLNAVRDDVATTDFDLGARRYLRNGELLTDADLAALKQHDAILLGAVGDPSVPPDPTVDAQQGKVAGKSAAGHDRATALLWWSCWCSTISRCSSSVPPSLCT